MKNSTQRVYLQAVDIIRAHGPMSAIQLGMRMAWSKPRATAAINFGRNADLLKRIGKTERGQFLFGAVQTADWPERVQP